MYPIVDPPSCAMSTQFITRVKSLCYAMCDVSVSVFELSALCSYLHCSADDRIHHIKVLRLNGKYSLQPSNFKSRVEFESLVDLVVHHSEHAFAVSDFFAKLKYAVNAD